MECARLKLALPTTQAPRFGKEKSMVESVIFGQQDAFYMKCALCTLLSEQKISQDFTER